MQIFYWNEPLFILLANAEAEAGAEAEAEAEAEGEAEEEMDIDDTTTGTVADESAYIGDNCLSTPVRNSYTYH